MENEKKSKTELWKEHFRIWEESGLSIGEYCELEGLSKSTFGYWRHRLKKAQAEQGLVELKVETSVNRELIHIRVKEDVELGVPTGTEVGYIAKLVGALNRDSNAD